MPVRVLDWNGEGDSYAIAKAIRYAANHGADVLNLSFEFGTLIRARQIPNILDAVRFATKRAPSWSARPGTARRTRSSLTPPGRGKVISVGATTEHGCVAKYSNQGPQLDLVAPGGGPDADLRRDPNCRPLARKGRDIVQITFTTDDLDTFGLPGRYVGRRWPRRTCRRPPRS